MRDEEGGHSIAEQLAPHLTAFKRHWKVAISPTVAFFAIASGVILRWPSYYTSEAVIFIQPQRMASKIVENTEHREEMSERLEALVQEILSRPRLRAILDQYQVYPRLRGVTERERAIRKFRDHIEILPAETPTGKQLLQTFRLSFTHQTPSTTFEVTKALSNLFIEESVVSRRSEVQGTQEFLNAELKEARKKLEQTEDLVQRFVSQNFGKLPEHIDQAVARLETAQAQLASNSQLIAANLQRKANLESEINEVRRAMGSVAIPSEGKDSPLTVQQLEAALAVLQSRYSEQHPDVVATKKRLEALRGQLGTSGGGRRGPVGGSAGGAMTLAIKRQLGEVDVTLTALKAENDHLKTTIEGLQKDIEQMPVREQELLRIKRDYANVKANYERLLGAREETGLQLSMIRSQKASQFGIVDPAEMPVLPAGPPRLLLLAVAGVASLGLFLALPLLVALLGHAYQTRAEVERDLPSAVLVVVPGMVTEEGKRNVWRQLGRSALFSALAVVVFGGATFFIL